MAAGADVNEGYPEPDPTDPDKAPWGPEALYHAAEFKDTACLELLLQMKPRSLYVRYCLSRALDFENLPAVHAFLRAGADPNFRIPWSGRLTALHKAVRMGRTLPIVRALVDAGGDPSLADHMGMTPYREAIRRGYAQIAQLLKARGAGGSNRQDVLIGAIHRGRNPPFAAGTSELTAYLCDAAMRNDVAVIASLLRAGAEPGFVGGGGMSALHCAAWRGHLEATALMIEHGVNLERKNQHGGTALSAAIHGSVHCSDPEGGPTMRLPEEIQHGNYPGVVELLINRGARLPERIQMGSEAVKEVLRRHGVPDVDDSAD